MNETTNKSAIRNPQSAIELLRRYEPVLKFTRGEQFFPLDAAAYVEHCSLWERFPNREAVCLIPKGELTLEQLSQIETGNPNAVRFLRFVEEVKIKDLATQGLQQLGIGTEEKNIFRAGRGRLARVGYFSRFADALFSFLLFARGRVPWSTAAAAAIAYKKIASEPRYYGRVVHQGNWLVSQYWFFYAFNNWRSGFFGTNDHEADWEMICIYLSDAALEKDVGEVKPEWVAYASHDNHGDDLRRHWNDTEVEKIDDHPVIYVGAGSHASYFRSGEYMTELPMPFLAPVIKIIERIQTLWRKLLNMDDEEEGESKLLSILRVPFVDYARGDGLTIGHQQEKSWDEPVLIEPPPAWVQNYRGLWGLFTGDPFAGEDAPAGAMHNRDGSIRSSWYDPVGWSGLEKVAPADRSIAITIEQKEKIQTRLDSLRKEVKEKRKELQGIGIETAALRLQPDLHKQLELNNKKIDELSLEVKNLRGQIASDKALLQSLERYEQALHNNEPLPLREHIRHATKPASQTELNRNRLAEIWAAASIGFMLIGFVALVLFAQQFLINALITIAFIVLLIESWFRKNFSRFVSNVTVGLALVSALILFYQFFWTSIIAIVLVAGVYILWENLRELWT
jgi:hypothetical protein